MLTWAQFREQHGDLADAGRSLFYQVGVGLGFLATVRRDGGPRVHPMCPLVTEDGLYAFIVPGPKHHDLVRDRRYAMHCFPPANSEDAFYVTGTARVVEDAKLTADLDALFWRERGKDTKPPESEDQTPFEFLVESCLLTRTTGIGDWNPQHTIWKASD